MSFMSTIIIFAIGVFVSALTFLGVVLVGLTEAADPSLSHPEDLSEWEWSMVGEARQKELSPKKPSSEVKSVPDQG